MTLEQALSVLEEIREYCESYTSGQANYCYTTSEASYLQGQESVCWSILDMLPEQSEANNEA